jgi:hypothetical protein
MPPRSARSALSLQNFIALGQLKAAYRALLRSTRLLPTLAARREAVAFYRPDFVLRPRTGGGLHDKDRVQAHLGAVSRAVKGVPWGAQARGGQLGRWEALGSGKPRDGLPRTIAPRRKLPLSGAAGKL